MTNGQQQERQPVTEAGGNENPDVLTSWDIRFPIVKSRFFLWDTVKLVLICFVIMVLPYGGILIVQGETKVLGLLILISGGSCFAIGLGILATSAVMYLHVSASS